MKNMKNSLLFCSRCYHRLVKLLFGITSVCLLLTSLVCTNYLDLEERSYLSWDPIPFQGLILLAAILLCRVPDLRRERPTPKPAWLRWAVLLLAGLAGILWVLSTRFLPFADPSLTAKVTEHLILQDYSDLQPGGYLSAYPHQCGLVLFHWVLTWLFQSRAALAFQLLNVCAYVVVLWCLGEFCLLLGRGHGWCLTATILGALFLPGLLYTTFVYGTLPGLALSCLACLWAIRFSRDGKWPAGILCAGAILAAILFKSNYQIFGIGIILYLLFRFAATGKWENLLLAAVLLPLVLFGGMLPVVILERKTGYSLRSGCTTLSWVVMGLGLGDGSRAPGWWDGYNTDTYALANYDPAVQKALVMQELGVRLRALRAPGYALSFFSQKTASQWADPLFESLWINQMMQAYTMLKTGLAQGDFPGFVNALLSPGGSYILARIFNVFQTLLYGGLLLNVCVPEETTEEESLLRVIFLGGFLFHLVWEAKGQYTLPYFLLAFPLALNGYRRLARADSSRLSRCLFLPALTVIAGLAVSLCLSAPLHSALQAYLAFLS